MGQIARDATDLYLTRLARMGEIEVRRFRFSKRKDQNFNGYILPRFSINRDWARVSSPR